MSNVIIETCPVVSAITGQIPITGTELIELINEFNGILHCGRTGIWTKISGTILLHLSGKQNSRILLSHRHFNIGIGFIILQHRIILWTVFLDQIIFQHKCFQLRICHNIFKSADQRHHLVNLRSSPYVFAEIRPDTIMQIDRFSHINNIILFIMHDVDSRTMGKLF